MLNNIKIFFSIKNSLYLCNIKSKDMKNSCLITSNNSQYTAL